MAASELKADPKPNPELSETQRENIDNIRIKDKVLKTASSISEQKKEELRKGERYQQFQAEFRDVFEVLNEAKHGKL